MVCNNGSYVLNRNCIRVISMILIETIRRKTLNAFLSKLSFLIWLLWYLTIYLIDLLSICRTHLVHRYSLYINRVKIIIFLFSLWLLKIIKKTDISILECCQFFNYQLFSVFLIIAIDICILIKNRFRFFFCFKQTERLNS